MRVVALVSSSKVGAVANTCKSGSYGWVRQPTMIGLAITFNSSEIKEGEDYALAFDSNRSPILLMPLPTCLEGEKGTGLSGIPVVRPSQNRRKLDPPIPGVSVELNASPRRALSSICSESLSSMAGTNRPIKVDFPSPIFSFSSGVAPLQEEHSGN